MDPFHKYLIEKGLFTEEILNKNLQEFQELRTTLPPKEQDLLAEAKAMKNSSSAILSSSTKDVRPEKFEKAKQESSQTFINTNEDSLLEEDLSKARNTLSLFESAEKISREETALLISENKSEVSKTIIETAISEDSDLPEELKCHLGDRYQVLETLGEGGMGVVQLVRDQILKREVALKKVKIKGKGFTKLSSHQKTMLWRLKREAEITAILEHPNIVPLYDMEKTEEGELQFTMRKVEGETLGERLRKKRAKKLKFGKEKIFSAFLKICNAVGYAHNRGVIHRDLKPDNIMIGQFGEVYVVDWGIAKKIDLEILSKDSASKEKDSSFLSENKENPPPPKNKVGLKGLGKEIIGSDPPYSYALDKITTPDSFPSFNENEAFSKETATAEGYSQDTYKTIGGMGTPGYMPPEQAEDANLVKPQSDVYALGMILRECFTLHSPLEEFNLLLEWEEQDISSEERDIRLKKIESYIPEDIQAIIKKACRENWEERYSCAQALADDIERYQKNVRVSAREYNSLEVFSKWITRNKQKIGALIFVLIAFFLFNPLFFTWQQGKQSQKKFEQLHQKSRRFTEIAAKIKNKDRKNLEQKMEALLESYGAIRQASQFKKIPPKIEHEFLQIGKALIQLSMETKNYQLAFFIAKSMGKISILNEAQKKELQNLVEEEQGRVQKKHLAKFAAWQKQLLSPARKKGEQVNAIFEISKMPEEEIYLKLINLLEEGKTYFIKNKKRVSIKDEYYVTMVLALGRLENQAAQEPLFQTLKEIEKYLLRKYPTTTKPLAEIRYMVALTKALSYLKTPNVALELSKIRFRMDYNGLFWKETEVAYQILAKFDPLEKEEPKAALGYFERGLAAQSRGDFEKATVDFTLAIRKNPRFGKAYYHRGLALYETKQFDKALADFSRVLILEPKKTHALLQRAKIFMKQGKIAASIKNCEQSIKVNPTFALPYYQRALAQIEKSDIEAAIRDLEKTLTLDPQFSEGFYQRGVAKRRQKNLKGALKDFNKAIELNPNEATFYLERGLAHYQQNNYPLTIQDCSKALNLNPNFARAYFQMGIALRDVGDLIGAMNRFNETIRLQSDFVEAYVAKTILAVDLSKIEDSVRYFYQAIELFEKQENYERMIQFSSQVISIAPQFAFGHFSLGKGYFYQKNLPQAIESFNRVIQLKPEDVESHYFRAQAFVLQGKFDLALDDYDQVLLSSKKGKYFVARGKCFLKKGKYKKGIEDFNRAIECSPQYLAAYLARGRAERKEGYFETSLATFTKVLKLAPDYSDAYIERGFTAFYQGDLDSLLIDFATGIHKKWDKKEFDSIIAYCNTALALKPDFSSALTNLAFSYFEKGDVEKTILNLERALALGQKRYKIYAILGRAYQKTGKDKKAIKHFLNALRLRKNQEISQELGTLLTNKIILLYRQKLYKEARKKIALFQQYVPMEHSDRQLIVEFLHLIEKTKE